VEAVKVFAPATVANIGPGFDVLGVAVTGCGDTVEARRIDKSGVVIEAIFGDRGQLSLDPTKNTAGIAALETLKIVGSRQGVALKLYKDMPLGSGLGSSAASAAAAAWAVAVLNDFTDKKAILSACLAAENIVSGYHADNVAPALLGGIILIREYQPLQLESLPVPRNLYLVLATPVYEVATVQARSVVPKMVDVDKVVANNGRLSAMIAAIFRNDVPALGRAAIDEIIEPARASLIPGFWAVKQAALESGAYGCSISGSGPTVFAICDNIEVGQKIGQVMQRAFREVGLESTVNVASIDRRGAQLV
jgi:homoserine kinase